MTRFRRPHTARAAALALGAALLTGGHVVAQQVIPQSLVVQGSLCTGFDCPNSPTFGFDTIILRENNLRIFFDDTSTAASFPRNDWRITVNDSANGGSSFFGVEDATANRRVFQLDLRVVKRQCRIRHRHTGGVDACPQWQHADAPP